MNGPQAIPGTYKAQLSVGEEMQEVEFEILQDPRSPATKEDYEAQFNFVKRTSEKVTEAHETIEEIREVRKQIKSYTERIDKEDESMKDLLELADEIDEKMTKVEEELYQTKNRSRQDPLNFPIRLTNKLGHLNSLSGGEYPPTEQMRAVQDELIGLIDKQLDAYQEVRNDDIPKFNELVKQRAIEAIQLKKAEDSSS